MCTAGEVRWLMAHSLREGKHWFKDGKFQTMDGQEDPRVSRFAMVTAEDERPLRYLEKAGFIEWNNVVKGSNALKLRVTVQGADYARQLGSPLGRANLWYRGHKDGLLGLMTTILVAFATALLASSIRSQGASSNVTVCPTPTQSVPPSATAHTPPGR